MLKTASVIKRLAGFSALHRDIELNLSEYLKDLVSESFINIERKNPLHPGYIEKNIFSILFIAIYDSIGIIPERQKLYGMINHCMRGIVTSSDNILDREYKFMLPLRFGTRGFFPSIMQMLLFDRLLYRILYDAEQRDGLSGLSMIKVENTLFRALLEIGLEEGGEEKGVEGFLEPERVLSEVHTEKGGNLLRLAFVAPRLLEKAPSVKERLSLADRGIFSIGMALQCIDDITDLRIDLKDRRHNYLASVICYQGQRAEKEALLRIYEGASVEEEDITIFPSSIKKAVEYAISEALRGFDTLSKAGFWIKGSLALNMLKILFRLRGVGGLVKFFPEKIAPSGENPFYDPSFGEVLS